MILHLLKYPAGHKDSRDALAVKGSEGTRQGIASTSCQPQHTTSNLSGDEDVTMKLCQVNIGTSRSS
jgi:hypothetical protein